MIWVLPTAAAVAWLVALGDRPAGFIAKPVASLGFVLIGLSGVPFDHRMGAFVLAGLVCAALGDVALMFERWFLAGLGLFAIGHLAYIAGFTRVAAPRAEWLVLGAAAALGAGRWLLPQITGTMRTAVTVYIVIIGVMLATAFSAGTRSVALPIGATMFVLSDLLVARERFVESDERNRLWGLPLYYAAQVLIASTIAR